MSEAASSIARDQSLLSQLSLLSVYDRWSCPPVEQDVPSLDSSDNLFQDGDESEEACDVPIVTDQPTCEGWRRVDVFHGHTRLNELLQYLLTWHRTCHVSDIPFVATQHTHNIFYGIHPVTTFTFVSFVSIDFGNVIRYIGNWDRIESHFYNTRCTWSDAQTDAWSTAILISTESALRERWIKQRAMELCNLHIGFSMISRSRGCFTLHQLFGCYLHDMLCRLYKQCAERSGRSYENVHRHMQSYLVTW